MSRDCVDLTQAEEETEVPRKRAAAAAEPEVEESASSRMRRLAPSIPSVMTPAQRAKSMKHEMWDSDVQRTLRQCGQPIDSEFALTVLGFDVGVCHFSWAAVQMYAGTDRKLRVRILGVQMVNLLDFDNISNVHASSVPLARQLDILHRYLDSRELVWGALRPNRVVIEQQPGYNPRSSNPENQANSLKMNMLSATAWTYFRMRLWPDLDGCLLRDTKRKAMGVKIFCQEGIEETLRVIADRQRVRDERTVAAVAAGTPLHEDEDDDAPSEADESGGEEDEDVDVDLDEAARTAARSVTSKGYNKKRYMFNKLLPVVSIRRMFAQLGGSITPTASVRRRISELNLSREWVLEDAAHNGNTLAVCFTHGKCDDMADAFMHALQVCGEQMGLIAPPRPKAMRLRTHK